MDKQVLRTRGTITNLLSGGQYRVECDNGCTVLATLTQEQEKLQKADDPVVGEAVVVELTENNLRVGTIIERA